MPPGGSGLCLIRPNATNTTMSPRSSGGMEPNHTKYSRLKENGGTIHLNRVDRHIFFGVFGS